MVSPTQLCFQMSAENATVIHRTMSFFIDNLMVDNTFLAEFRPGNIFSSDVIEDIMVTLWKLIKHLHSRKICQALMHDFGLLVKHTLTVEC